MDNSVTFAPRTRKKTEPSAREKAIEFSKQIPKPKARPEKPKEKPEFMGSSPQKEAFDKLAMKHEMYSDQLA